MKKYGKLEEEVLVYAPINYIEEDGVIINFNKDEELMKQYGYKTVVENVPLLEEGQYIEIQNYTEDEATITVNYGVTTTKPQPTLKDKIEELEKINTEQDELINTTMLAADEMFTMLEPLLEEVVTLLKSDSKIVDLYVAIIKRELKTIEEVPLKYKEMIEKHLK